MSQMNGIELDAREFAFLLKTVNATSIIGFNDPALFPTDQEASDETYEAGLQLLKENGWIRPTNQQSQFHLDSTLYYMVTVVANPEFATFTFTETGASGVRSIIHFMDGIDIVELTFTSGGKYRLGVIPERTTQIRRIESLLDFHDSKQQIRLQFFAEEETFEHLQKLCREDQHKQARNVLEKLGLGGLSVDSLLIALSKPRINEFFVVKAENGQLKAWKKAQLLKGGDILWLVKRTDSTPTTISVEAVQSDTLPKLLDSFIQFLNL